MIKKDLLKRYESGSKEYIEERLNDCITNIVKLCIDNDIELPQPADMPVIYQIFTEIHSMISCIRSMDGNLKSNYENNGSEV